MTKSEIKQKLLKMMESEGIFETVIVVKALTDFIYDLLQNERIELLSKDYPSLKGMATKEQGECQHSVAQRHIGCGEVILYCMKCGVLLEKKKTTPKEDKVEEVEKLDLTDSTIYNGYHPRVDKMPDYMDRLVCMALCEVEDKINEIIYRLNKGK